MIKLTQYKVIEKERERVKKILNPLKNKKWFDSPLQMGKNTYVWVAWNKDEILDSGGGGEEKTNWINSKIDWMKEVVKFSKKREVDRELEDLNGINQIKKKQETRNKNKQRLRERDKYR